MLTFCNFFALLQCLSDQVLDSVAWHYGNLIPGAQKILSGCPRQAVFPALQLTFHTCAADRQGPRQVVF